MNVSKIVSASCYKQNNKQNFNGASISEGALKVFSNRIMDNPDELEDFNAIRKLNVNIELDKYSPSNIKFLVVRNKNNNNRLVSSLNCMKMLRTNIERFCND